MNKILFVLIAIAICCSSCFQVIEEINVRNNGSGDVTLTLNFSQSKTKLASIMLLDSVSGYKVPSKTDVQRKLNETVEYLRKSEGISNVKKSLDFNNFIATISFSFNDVSNLNNLTDDVMKSLKVKNVNQSSFVYNKNQGSFSRSYVYTTDAKTEYNKLNEDAKSVFKSAAYTGIYRFENEIATFNNKLSTVSKSRKAIMMKASVLDLINGRVNISNKIQLTK